MISFQHVSFDYPGRPIFADLSFSIREGRTTAIMGPSGSGKTTLLRLACGLVEPTAGAILMGDANVTLGSVRGLVFHEDTLLPWLTIVENVVLAAERDVDARHRAHSLLREFGLAESCDAYPYELSEGMRKRAEFARALVSDDHLLLLDEPFVSLDRETRRRFWKLWVESTAIQSRTRIIVTHDVEEVRAIADDVLVVGAGRPAPVHPPCDVATVLSQLNELSEEIAVNSKITPSRLTPAVAERKQL